MTTNENDKNMVAGFDMRLISAAGVCGVLLGSLQFVKRRTLSRSLSSPTAGPEDWVQTDGFGAFRRVHVSP